MRAIWKFLIPVQDIAKIEMPTGAQILAVKDPHGWGPIPVWAEVDTEAEVVSRIFYVVGTGNPIEFQDGRPFQYVGTVQQNDGALVWHVYDGQEVAVAYSA